MSRKKNKYLFEDQKKNDPYLDDKTFDLYGKNEKKDDVYGLGQSSNESSLEDAEISLDLSSNALNIHWEELPDYVTRTGTIGKQETDEKQIQEEEQVEDQEPVQIDYQEPEFETTGTDIGLTSFGRLRSLLRSDDLSCNQFSSAFGDDPDIAMYALAELIKDEDFRIDNVDIEESDEGCSISVDYSVATGYSFGQYDVTRDWVQIENSIEADLVENESPEVAEPVIEVEEQDSELLMEK